MSEQLSSDREDDSSQSADSSEDLQEEEVLSCKTMSQYAREFICFLAFFLTTYATFQNRSQKYDMPLPRTYLFDKNSPVHEYFDGQLREIQNNVAVSELSLIFFYAPWCAESHYAKNTIENLAKQYRDEIYVAAVNCWQPGGECRMHYPRVDSWPILMAYYPRGLAVQYSGHWNFKSVSLFVEKLLNPLKRIETEYDLMQKKLENYAVVVGFFSTTRSSDQYRIFFQAAVKSLEHYHRYDVEYAIVTGSTTKLFNKTSLPVIEMHSLNETVLFKEKSWSIDGINNWVKKNFDTRNIWIEISGKKSWNLSNYLNKAPIFIVFHPRNYLDNYNDDVYYLLKRIAFAYNDCRLNRSSSEMNMDIIKSLRERNVQRKHKLNLKCMELNNQLMQNLISAQKSCVNTELLKSEIDFQNSRNVNMYKYQSNNQRKQEYSKTKYLYSEIDNLYKKTNDQQFLKNVHSIDTRSTSYILQKYLENECRKMSLTKKDLDYDVDSSINENFIGMGCKYNRTLTFVMADSDLHNYMISSLGTNLPTKKSSKTLIFIIDKEKESTYQLKEEISVNSITKFIENFHNNSLSRNFRRTVSSSFNKFQNTSRKQIQIKEINSMQFQNTLKFTNESIIVFFYTRHCALCNLLSRILINLQKILKLADIKILRIDGENNDLAWEYTMDSFPTLLVVPKGRKIDGKIYPKNIPISMQNILRFILTVLDRTERLKLLLAVCQSIQTEKLLPNCMRNIRIEILNCISDNLFYWRHTGGHEREKIERNFQILQKMYFLTFQMKDTIILRTISNNIVM